jgi:hypothetical protein
MHRYMSLLLQAALSNGNNFASSMGVRKTGKSDY